MASVYPEITEYVLPELTAHFLAAYNKKKNVWVKEEGWGIEEDRA